jgi:hypothetical protein
MCADAPLPLDHQFSLTVRVLFLRQFAHSMEAPTENKENGVLGEAAARISLVLWSYIEDDHT